MTEPETEQPKRKPRFLRFFAYALFLTVLLAAAGSGLAYYVFYDQVQRPGVPGEIVEVEIPKGATGDTIGAILADHGLIGDAVFFRLALRLAPEEHVIKAGRYDLPHGVSANQLLELLADGPKKHFSPEDLPPDQIVTIPEGLTIAQMANMFEDSGAFHEAVAEIDVKSRFGFDAPSPEGFLMPNTYYFDAPPEPAEVVGRMTDHFEEEWNRLLDNSASPPDRDPLDVLIVASLVEEEARVDDERPIIAAVIYNRLARGMSLDMDSTLQYALNKYGQRMLNRDKETDSPYNTYKHPGLPPGPISNPGVESLRAALNPADVDYLYFVSNADGKTHTFSRTLAEHNRAVARYRREIAEQRRELKAQ